MDIFAVFRVLQRGESLKDPATWKNRAQAVMALSGILALAVHLLEYFHVVKNLGFTSADADLVAGGVVTVVGMYFNYATSDKVGVGPKPDPVPAAASVVAHDAAPAPYVVAEYAGPGSEQSAQPAAPVASPAGAAVLNSQPVRDFQHELDLRGGP